MLFLGSFVLLYIIVLWPAISFNVKTNLYFTAPLINTPLITDTMLPLRYLLVIFFAYTTGAIAKLFSVEQNHDTFNGHIILGDDENIVIADQGPIGSPIGTVRLNTSAWLDQEQWHFNGTYTEGLWSAVGALVQLYLPNIK